MARNDNSNSSNSLQRKQVRVQYKPCTPSGGCACCRCACMCVMLFLSHVSCECHGLCTYALSASLHMHHPSLQDFYQLLSPTVSVLTGPHQPLYTLSSFQQEQQLSDPKLWVDMKALMGDPSDNIPGVRGVGQKTAHQLVQSLGTVEHIIQQLHSMPEEQVKQVRCGAMDAAHTCVCLCVRVCVFCVGHVTTMSKHQMLQCKRLVETICTICPSV